MNAYVKFELIETKPKTNVYSVINIRERIEVGIIKWFPPWRQYCFFPDEAMVFNRICMNEIADFITEKMKEEYELPPREEFFDELFRREIILTYFESIFHEKE